MSLLGVSKQFLGWFWRVFTSFWRAKRAVSLFLIASAVVEKVSNLLAFVLPLKIVLLASSDGVPGYFSGFISPESKIAWVVGLSVAALFFYVLGFGLNILANHLAKVGGGEVVSLANDISLASSQAEKVNNYYATCCSVLSSSIFGLFGLIAIGILNQFLFLTILASFLFSFGLSSLVFRAGRRGSVSWVVSLMEGDLSGYLNLWTYGVFIFGFLVVL